jgi:spore germination protein GerM
MTRRKDAGAMTDHEISGALPPRAAWLVAALALLLACLALLAACGGDGDEGSTASSGSGATTADAQAVTAWFSGDDGRLVAEERAVSGAPDPLTAAMRAVVAGPETPGLLPAVPPGTSLRSAERAGSVALVDLSREFVTGFPGAGSADQIAVLGPLVWTATGIQGVSEVLLTAEGAVPEIPGLQFDLSAPLTREDLPADAGAVAP